MSIQQVLQPVVTAMRLVLALRQLRDAEMLDARRWRDVFGRSRDETARAYIGRHVGQYVARARTHNRRLVRVQRKLRETIENGTAGDTIRRAVRQ